MNETCYNIEQENENEKLVFNATSIPILSSLSFFLFKQQ